VPEVNRWSERLEDLRAKGMPDVVLPGVLHRAEWVHAASCPGSVGGSALRVSGALGAQLAGCSDHELEEAVTLAWSDVKELEARIRDLEGVTAELKARHVGKAALKSVVLAISGAWKEGVADALDPWARELEVRRRELSAEVLSAAKEGTVLSEGDLDRLECFAVKVGERAVEGGPERLTLVRIPAHGYCVRESGPAQAAALVALEWFDEALVALAPSWAAHVMEVLENEAEALRLKASDSAAVGETALVLLRADPSMALKDALKAARALEA
jgi:hypothetical protein